MVRMRSSDSPVHVRMVQVRANEVEPIRPVTAAVRTAVNLSEDKRRTRIARVLRERGADLSVARRLKNGATLQQFVFRHHELTNHSPGLSDIDLMGPVAVVRKLVAR